MKKKRIKETAKEKQDKQTETGEERGKSKEKRISFLRLRHIQKKRETGSDEARKVKA